MFCENKYQKTIRGRRKYSLTCNPPNKQFFLHIGFLLSFYCEYIFWYFFRETSHGSRLGTRIWHPQIVVYFLFFFGFYFEVNTHIGGGAPKWSKSSSCALTTTIQQVIKHMYTMLFILCYFLSKSFPCSFDWRFNYCRCQRERATREIEFLPPPTKALH